MADSQDQKADTLRKLIHDLNGELFLIRGYADLTYKALNGEEPVSTNLKRLIERTDEVEKIMIKLKARQQQIEP